MKRITGLVLTLLITYISATAQENSPYSRYGLGDLVPAQNIITRGMGGIAAGYSDEQSINFINPASYGNLSYIDPYTLKFSPLASRRTVFDFGFEIGSRTLKQIDQAAKYSATSINISYVQLGVPVKMAKANKKGIFLGLNFGLKPVSRINYKIAALTRKQGVDSIGTLYEGTGGMSEATFGTGLRIKDFNIGFNSGYRFGNKSYSTQVSVLNDSVYHYASNSQTKTNFGGMFFTLGTQYEIRFKNKITRKPTGAVLRLGAYTGLSQKMNGTEDLLRQTVKFDSENGMYQVDSVFASSREGIVNYPSNWGAGFTYSDSSGHWNFGADYERYNWGSYLFFGQKDNVQNTWKLRAGAEYLPADRRTAMRKYFSHIKYRAGFNYGPSYVNLGTNLPEYSFSIGAGLPLKLRRTSVYETQLSYLNTAIEFGSRGNKSSNLRESFFRISFGFALSDLWFNRQKYY